MLVSTQMSLFRETYVKNLHPQAFCHFTLISWLHGLCHLLLSLLTSKAEPGAQKSLENI